MLVELAVRDLGVIASARMTLAPGSTALTGETGAGKTMIVEALELLRGGRADPARVRSGADEAVVEALFVVDEPDGSGAERELVLRRVVPATGRSRAYVDGSLVPASQLEALASELLEIHGQHAQQGLLRPAAQREALDRHGGVDTQRLDGAVARMRSLERQLEQLGGDHRVRARELDLLRHQLDEIDAAALVPGEWEQLEQDEDLLAGALEHRAAAASALEALAEDDGSIDQLAAAASRLRARGPLAALGDRIESIRLDLVDALEELRATAGSIEVDDDRLAIVRARRQAIVELCRKYGDRIEDVLEFAADARARLAELEAQERAAETIDEDLRRARTEVASAAAEVGDARRAVAPELSAAVTERLRTLAMPDARVEVVVEDTDDLPGAGAGVTLLLAANRGAAPGPLQRVASGGELSRVMLALRLVSSGGPPTMVFDEVDAGIGGAAASAVADALAGVARQHQVLVVTHLPQIAAVATAQFGVSKSVVGAVTETSVAPLEGEARVAEVSRMLSGSPDSSTARRHAAELLAAASGVRP